MAIGVGGDDSQLSEVCSELNFKHSLVSEGNQMRALALRALEHSAGVLDRVAATYRERVGRWRLQRPRRHRLCQKYCDEALEVSPNYIYTTV